MANTIIQVRRSNTSLTPGTTLNYGELAFSYNTASTGNTLYIGAQTGVGTAAIAIGGFKYNYLNNLTTPGIVAANATIVTDANSFVNNVYTTGLVVYQQSNTTLTNANFLVNSSALWINNVPLYANGGVGGAGQVLTSNGATGSPYWSTVTSGSSGVGSAATTDVIFADGTNPNGTAGFTFTKGTNAVTIGNTLTIGTTVVYQNSFAVGTIGASTNGSLLSNTLLQVGNTSVYSNVIPGAIYTTSNVVTTNVIATSVNASANVTTVNVIATSVNASANVTTVNVYATTVNATANVQTNTVFATNVNATTFSSSANVIVANVILTNITISVTGNTTTAPTLTLASNSSAGITYGNSTVTGAPTFALQTNTGVPYIQVANGTGLATSANLYSNGLIVGTTVVNGTFVTAGSVNATSNVITVNVIATSVNASANVTTVNVIATSVNASANVTTVNVIATSVNASANVTTTNVYASFINATANVTAPIYYGNVVATVVNASANIGVGTIGASTNGTLITNASIYVGTTTVYVNAAAGSLTATANVIAPTHYGNVVATVVNASANMGVGTIGAASNGVLITNTLFQVGNTSVYSNVIPGAIYTTSNVNTVNVYATTVNASANVITTNVYATTVNASSNVVTTNVIATSVNASANVTTVNVIATSVNASANVTTVNVIATTVNASANVITVNVYATTVNATANVQTNSVFATNVTATTITATNAVITGNLTVSGTLSTIDTVSLVIKDNIIGLADQNSPNYISATGYAPQIVADSVDFGLIGSAPVQTQTNYATTTNGTTTVTIASNTNFYPGQLVTGTNIPANTYITATTSTTLTISNPASGSGAGTINAYYTAFYGMARVQATNTFTFFVSNAQISSSTYPANNFPFQTTVGAASQQLMPLSFLGVNSTSTGVTIAANSTVNVNITANTLTLSSALGVASGGTGASTLTANAVLLGNGTGPVGFATIGANGTVLQISGNIPAFGGIDGGAF